MLTLAILHVNTTTITLDPASSKLEVAPVSLTADPLRVTHAMVQGHPPFRLRDSRDRAG